MAGYGYRATVDATLASVLQVEEEMSWEIKENFHILGTVGKTYKNGALQVIVTKDPPDDRWHLSISHPHRYPTWDEIKRARYDLLPDEITMAMLLPPKSEYVNVHQNCFHLHEWREKEIVPI